MEKELKDYYSDTSGQNNWFFVQLNGAVSSAMSHLDVNNVTIKSKIGTKRTQKEIPIQCSFLKLAHLEGARESKWAIQRHQLCAGVFILTFSTITWKTPLTRSWSPVNIGQLRIASPHEQHRIANYSTTVPLSVLQRFLNCICMSHNIDLIASLKSIGTFDPQPIQSLALRLSRPSPQPLLAPQVL